MFNSWYYFYTYFFRHQSNSEKATSNSNENTTNDSSSQGKNDDLDDKTDQFMYIQMEFCEKSTLRYRISIIIRRLYYSQF